jgi:hypothetical protein
VTEAGGEILTCWLLAEERFERVPFSMQQRNMQGATCKAQHARRCRELDSHSHALIKGEVAGPCGTREANMRLGTAAEGHTTGVRLAVGGVQKAKSVVVHGPYSPGGGARPPEAWTSLAEGKPVAVA